MGLRVETGLRNCARTFVDNLKKKHIFIFGQYWFKMGFQSIWFGFKFVNFSIFQLIKVKVGDGETHHYHHYHNDYDQYCCQYVSPIIIFTDRSQRRLSGRWRDPWTSNPAALGSGCSSLWSNQSAWNPEARYFWSTLHLSRLLSSQ